MRRTWIALPLGLMMILPVAGCANSFSASRPIDLAIVWEDFEHIQVRTLNGRVDLAVDAAVRPGVTGKRVARGPSPEEAEAALDQFEVVIEKSPDAPRTLVIEVRPEKVPNRSIGAELTIRIPAACSADIRTSNGAVRGQDLRGPFTARTSNGAVEALRIDGPVNLTTSNGPITAEAISGELTGDTSNGDITLRDVRGNARIQTSNGGVTATGVVGNLDAVTSNGVARVDVTPDANGSLVLRTSNGAIDATVPATMNAEVSIATSNGRVTTEWGAAEAKIRTTDRGRVDGTLNAGGGKIELRSSNGNVTLRTRGA